MIYRSQREEQEPREEAEVAVVVIETVTSWQAEVDVVTGLQEEGHTGGAASVTAVSVELQAEENPLGVPVQVHAPVAIQEVSHREQEAVESSHRSPEDAYRKS